MRLRTRLLHSWRPSGRFNTSWLTREHSSHWEWAGVRAERDRMPAQANAWPAPRFLVHLIRATALNRPAIVPVASPGGDRQRIRRPSNRIVKSDILIPVRKGPQFPRGRHARSSEARLTSVAKIPALQRAGADRICASDWGLAGMGGPQRAYPARSCCRDQERRRWRCL